MASVGGGTSLTSDELMDYKCSVCFKRGTNVAAVVYCADCQDYYCKTCSDFVHAAAPALENHKLISEDVANGDGRLPRVPTSRCDRHRSKIIDMYCQDHDEVGCTTCMVVDHRTCSVFDIPEFVHTNNKVVPEFIQTIQDIESDFDTFLNTFQQEEKFLHHNKQTVIARIQSEQTRLENSIRKAAENAIEEVDNKYTKMSDIIKDKIQTLHCEKDKIKKAFTQPQSSSSNEPQTFVDMKKNKALIPAAQQVKKDMRRVELDKRLMFIRDDIYEPVVKQTCLGKITEISPCLYSVSQIGTVDVTSITKRRGVELSFYDSCCTSDGSVFFTEMKQSMLIRVCSKNMKVVEHIKLQSRPRGVCRVSDTEIAVCLGKTIQIISTDGRLQLTRSVHIENDCSGLTYQDGVFYAASSDSVYKYNMEGDLLQTFITNFGGNKLFSSIWNLAINPLNNYIHITDVNNGVITIDQNGDVMNIVKKYYSKAFYMTVNTSGQVFVSCYVSVIQLTCDGKFLRTIINGSLGVLCIDEAVERIFVVDGGKIKVYSLNL